MKLFMIPFNFDLWCIFNKYKNMKKQHYITLECGTKVPMSDESYQALVDASREVKTYGDVMNKLFKSNDSVYFFCDSDDGSITSLHKCNLHDKHLCNNIVGMHPKQLKSILALNQLMNVAKYLNGDWKPNHINIRGGYFIYQDDTIKNMTVKCHNSVTYGMIYFKDSSLAYKAIEILGKETIKQALNLNH